MSSSSSSIQNIAFVSSSNNNNNSTNEAVSTAQGVNTDASNIDNLSDAFICAFLASQPCWELNTSCQGMVSMTKPQISMLETNSSRMLMITTAHYILLVKITAVGEKVNAVESLPCFIKLKMELEINQNNALLKLPKCSNSGSMRYGRLRIKLYFRIQDYALWEVIENGNSWVPIPVITPLETGTSTTTKMTVPSTIEEKTCKKNDYVTTKVILPVLKFVLARLYVIHTVYAFLSTQPKGSQLVHEDLEQLHDDDLEEMDLKCNMALLSKRARKFYQRTGRKIIIDGSNTAGYDKSKVECFNCHKIGHFARECRAPRSKDNRNKNQGSSTKAVKIKDASEKAMCAIDGAGFDWSDMAEEEIQANMALMAFSYSEVTNDKSCSKNCLKNYEALKKQYDDLLVILSDTDFKTATYKRGLATLEDQIVKYREHEVRFSEEIALLKRSVGSKEYQLELLRTELEKVKQEKEGVDFKIAKFDKSAKDLDQLLGSQITNNSKKGLGYSTVPPPHPLIYNRSNKLDLSYSGLDEFKEPEFKGYGPENNKKESNVVCENSSNETKKNSDAPLIEEWVSYNEDEVESPVVVKKKTIFPTIAKIKFVRPKQNEKPVRKPCISYFKKIGLHDATGRLKSVMAWDGCTNSGEARVQQRKRRIQEDVRNSKKKDQEMKCFGRILLAKKIKTIEELTTAGYRVTTASSDLCCVVEKVNVLKFLLVVSCESVIVDKCKKGLGYNPVPPPYIGNFMPSTPDLSFTGLDEFVDKPVIENRKSDKEVSKVVRKSNDSPIIEDWVSDSEEENVSQTKTEKIYVKPSIAKIEFVKPKKQEKTTRKTVKQVEKHRQNTHSPKGNQRNWNNMVSQRLGSNFEMFNKACYVCGSFDHLQVDCNYHHKQFQKQRMVKPVWNNAQRVNHQNFAKKTHPCAKKNMVPRAVLINFVTCLLSIKYILIDRQVNAAHTKTTVNAARPMSYLSKKAHSTVKRPIHKNTTFKNSNFNQRVNTVKDKNVNTVRPKAVEVVNACLGQKAVC
ncbi:ribonuclease H-like domain-containing protein [Tanacetum coccineum]|uniref:Ribonuclease H-like domain-containing protein n=1 Tax=Tanacetum coccineum TaxID=301880 RepID=A0ABQ5D7M7_9ASTR